MRNLKQSVFHKTVLAPSAKSTATSTEVTLGVDISDVDLTKSDIYFMFNVSNHSAGSCAIKNALVDTVNTLNNAPVSYDETNALEHFTKADDTNADSALTQATASADGDFFVGFHNINTDVNNKYIGVTMDYVGFTGTVTVQCVVRKKSTPVNQ